MSFPLLPAAPFADGVSSYGLQLGLDGGDAGSGLLPPLQILATAHRGREVRFPVVGPGADDFVLQRIANARQRVTVELLLG